MTQYDIDQDEESQSKTKCKPMTETKSKSKTKTKSKPKSETKSPSSGLITQHDTVTGTSHVATSSLPLGLSSHRFQTRCTREK